MLPLGQRLLSSLHRPAAPDDPQPLGSNSRLAADFLASDLPSYFPPGGIRLSKADYAKSALCGAPHKAEIGAAWSKRLNEGRDYLSVKLDDPSFTQPIYANLFDAEDGAGYSLIWSRSRKAGAD